MKHLDEATIQSFLDGELNQNRAAEASAHLALCEICADALVAAEAEQTEINFAFASEAESPVPSQRIWARIENELEPSCAWQSKIAVCAEKTWRRRLSEFFTPAQIGFAAALAAVVLVSLFGVAFFEKQLESSNQFEAVVIAPQESLPSIAIPRDTPRENVFNQPNPIKKNPVAPKLIKQTQTQNFAPRTIKAVAVINKPEAPKNQAIAQNPKSKTQNPKSEAVLPEERSYLNSIALLSKAVAANDNLIRRPSFRVEYESSLATVDGSIAAMQAAARQHPQDQNAKRLLLAAYQNKIELLNTVSEKSQMVASLR